MGKLLKEAKKTSSMDVSLEMKHLVENLQSMSDEEREEGISNILDKLEENQEKLEKEIEKHKNIKSGKGWDFSKEKELKILVQSDKLIIRNIQEADKEKYIQIKKENSDTPHFYQEEGYCESIWKDTQEDNSFCCSVTRKADQNFLGYVALKNTTTNLWEVAIEFLNEYCHQGYGTEALKLFLPTIAHITRKTQFQALVEVDNIRSQKLMEKLGARLIDIYDYVFNGDEEAAEAFEAEHLDEITDRMVEQARQLGVEPRKMLSHVLDYRFFVENGEILNRAR